MRQADPIRYFNRSSGEIETESVYGERFLRWAYETRAGRITVAAIVKRPFFSRWYGWRMDRASSRARIGPFIESFGVDAGDFVRAPEEFESFNAFFARRLKPEARPIDADPDAVVFPADGRHIGFADVREAAGVFVKGQRFSIENLLGGDRELATRFADGSLVLSRLCPVDYHRYHFPCDGRIAEVPKELPGFLYSVNPIALRQRLARLWENRRMVTKIETKSFGLVLMIEIGATCVGSMVSTAEMPGEAGKGGEKGYFKFGGSSVITLFEHGRVRLEDDLQRWSASQTEIYARMGDRMGMGGN